MKPRMQTLIIMSLAALTLLFAFLWQREKNGREELRLLAQAGAIDACTAFAQYQKDGGESSYWSGVAAFRSFEQAYYLLTENTNKSGNYIFCNEVYGALLIHPERCRQAIADVIAVMELLAQDVEDERGYVKMAELRSALKYD